jgi:hypothetical protein
MIQYLYYELKLKIIYEYLTMKDSVKLLLSNKSLYDEMNINLKKYIGCRKICKLFNSSYFMNRLDIKVIWEIPLVSIRICKKKSYLILKIGDFISYWGREEGVKITGFTGYDNDPGPIGFEYLPWYGDRFATPIFSMRGNPRHIIAYPTGLPKYGEHINWYSIRILEKL